MPDENNPNTPADPLEAAFGEFREAWFSDQRPDPDAFCESHPDCGSALRERIENFLMVSADLLEEKKPGDLSPERIVGDFRILREIGRGGMGVVYEAEQISLGRKVALKILPSHLGYAKETVLKFRREAKAGGRQSHPGIVAIFGVGEHEGVHYIAQELVEESFTLEDRLDAFRKKGDLPPGYFQDTAECIAEAADALHHAHEAGVIHRDVKPSNILLTSDGHPKITDFGLAKLEDAIALSRTGDFAGTPFYMSPEQITSRGKRVDRRTDIYSLGVSLYEMLTLKHPFEGKSSYEVLKKIPVVEPTDPWRINPRAPKDLSTICLKAMEKSPEKRYQTMKAFEEDLRRYLSGEVIIARPAGAATKIMKRIKRNPLMSGAFGVAALAVLALMAWGVVYFIQMQSRYEEIQRHSDLNLVYRLKAESDDLWPAHPRKVEDINRWIQEARGLLARNVQYRAEWDRLRSTGQIDANGIALRDNLESLILEIDTLGEEASGLIMNVAERLRFAETVREESIEKQKDNWDMAIASIADEQECPEYKGLEMKPILGLVPIGRDPDSGLWEFAHLQTGKIPKRDPKTDRLLITEETGLVFVLVPGGDFKMGVLPQTKENPLGADYVDPSAEWNEYPLTSVSLIPFLLSKYEMTQGQWMRITGHNPSLYTPGSFHADYPTGATLRNPVEMVSWNDCDQVMGRLELVLPSEAQWEYACRAGTKTPWYTGADSKSLKGYENIADLGSRTGFLKGTTIEDGFIDGYIATAPVGSFLPNPFGIHDMLGNVTEWCRDRWPQCIDDFIGGDGDRIVQKFVWTSKMVVHRGGNFRTVGRVSRRDGQFPDFRSEQYGLRPAILIERDPPDEYDMKALPPEQEEELQASWDKAVQFVRDKKHQEAVLLYRELLEKHIQNLGKDHYNCHYLREGLAWAFFEQGIYSEAEVCFRQLMEDSIRVSGEAHLKSLFFRYCYGRTLNRQFRHSKAEAQFRKVYEGYLPWLGEDNPITHRALRSLAIAIMQNGKYGQAEPLYRKLLELQVRLLTRNHWETVWSRNLLGWTLLYLGRYEEAEPFFMQNKKISEDLYGDAYRDRLFAMENLASVRMGQGRLSEARSLIDEVVDIRCRRLNQNDKRVYFAMCVLGNVLKMQGELKEAEAVHAQALDLRRNDPKGKQRHTIDSMRCLALVYAEQERYAEAEELLLEAIQIAEEIFIEESLDRLSYHKDFGSLLVNMEKHQEAEEQLLKAYNGYQKNLGNEHVFTQDALQLLIELYEAWGRPDKVAEYRIQVTDKIARPK